MTESELRARLTGAGSQGTQAVGAELDNSLGCIPAAVLVGIVTGPTPGVLLTRRTAHLRTHSGQVSFPGGRIDAEDASPEAAALREAHEEVGLDPSQVETLGRLPDTVTVSNYRVTPVLGLLRPGFVSRPSAYEVDAVFQLPLAVLLDPAAPQRHAMQVRGVHREYWVWPHPEQYIWGTTAAILVQLAERLTASVRQADRRQADQFAP